MNRSAHIDTFARDNLPPADQWSDLTFDLPELQYPERLNCGVELLDRMVEEGHGSRRCIVTPTTGTWSYAELLDKANRLASVLVEDLGVVPGNRVLMRGANNAMMAALWFAVMKAGAIAVATMPLLRAKELAYIVEKARIDLAVTDGRLIEEIETARAQAPRLKRIATFNTPNRADAVEPLMAAKSGAFETVDTASDDVSIIAFTSGTTGQPKGTMHFHRDVMAINDTFPKYVLKPEPDDLFCGSPPLAFTFGLGGLLTFPLRYGAATLLLERPSPDLLAEAIETYKPTVCFTAPTAYRALAGMAETRDLSSLKRCVSAGETLPRPTWEAFRDATGIRIIDGIGATEMLHIFISAADDDIRPGATGKPVPGYEAKVIGEDGREVPPGTVGRLAVRGPTGCRYLADDRQKTYVRDGWNLTSDAYLMDEDGYFWYQARTDDMIVASGYNIAGPEVEEALLAHEAVADCAVVGSPDPERGTVVKAFVVLAEGVSGSPELTKALQDFVKASIAPYKYPRAIEYVTDLPRTETGKIQRFRLRQLEQERARQASCPPNERRRSMTGNGEMNRVSATGLETLLPAGWPKPPGYANGIAGRGRIVFVAGQVGWDETGTFVAEDFVGQTRQALLNVLAVLAEAGLGPQHLGRMTWYVTDMDAYRSSLRGLGAVYREVIGPHYPAMSLVQVVSLVEPQALVEIEATAIDPEGT